MSNIDTVNGFQNKYLDNESNVDNVTKTIFS